VKTRLLVLCLVLALGSFVAACGGDDGGDSGSGGGEPAGQSGGAGGAPGEVTMEAIEFVPADVTVAVGDTVTWTNNEAVGHDVTKEGGPGPDFSSGEPGGMQEGDTFEHTFEAAGTVDYVCTVHPGMTGTVTVE
jgi:plastocyanin